MVDWQPGQVILDEYLIEKELGRGGMGCVWLVKSNSTGHRFAVKQTILKEEKHRKAFLAELQTWIDLPEHPNIVPCRFFRVVEDDIFLFAEYLDGGSLADWIRQCKLVNLQEIFHIAIHSARGLQAVHECGLIHNDIKPDNILMTIGGTPKISDFGISRLKRFVAEEESVNHNQGINIRTPIYPAGFTLSYASPEQVNGLPVTFKTDMWSWGVTLLDLILGRVSCPNCGYLANIILNSIESEHGHVSNLGVFSEVLHSCFQTDFSKRPDSFRDIYKLLTKINKGDGQNHCDKAEESEIPSMTSYSFIRCFYGINKRSPAFWIDCAKKFIGNTPSDNAAGTYAKTREGMHVGDIIEYNTALQMFRQALELRQDNHRDIKYLMAGAMTDYATTLAVCGNTQEALNILNTAIAIYADHNIGALCLSEAHADSIMCYIAISVRPYTQYVHQLNQFLLQSSESRLRDKYWCNVYATAVIVSCDVYREKDFAECNSRIDVALRQLSGFDSGIYGQSKLLELKADSYRVRRLHADACTFYEKSILLRKESLRQMLCGQRDAMMGDLLIGYAKSLAANNRYEAAHTVLREARNVLEFLVLKGQYLEYADSVVVCYNDLCAICKLIGSDKDWQIYNDKKTCFALFLLNKGLSPSQSRI